MEVNQKNISVNYNLGTILAGRGSLEAAKTCFTKVLRQEPNHPEAHNNLGSVLLRQGRFEDAVVHCRKATQLRDDFYPAELNVGIALSVTGKCDEAVEHLAHASRLAPMDAVTHFHFANALDQHGDTAEAAEHYAQAIELKPSFVPAMVALATIRATSSDSRCRDADEAIELATQACELTRQRDPVALDALAAAQAAAGRFPAAMATARRAIEIARSAGAKDLAHSIQVKLQRYQHHQTCQQ